MYFKDYGGIGWITDAQSRITGVMICIIGVYIGRSATPGLLGQRAAKRRRRHGVQRGVRDYIGNCKGMYGNLRECRGIRKGL